MRRIIMLSLPVIILIACSSVPLQEGTTLTPDLRARLSDRKNDSARIDLTAFCAESEVAGALREFARAGMSAIPVAEGAFTISITRAQVEELVGMKFICMLDLNQEQKFDPLLRRKVESMIRDRSGGMISVLGQCSTEITAAMHAQLDVTGAVIGSVIKDVFTARCSRRAVYLLASLDMVTLLQLSQESDMQR